MIVLVVAMVNLAFWQLAPAPRATASSTPRFGPTPTSRSHRSTICAPSIDQPSPIEWRRVDATGTYVPGHQFLVVNRSQNGDPGQNVVDALQLDDGSLMLVNRGFVRESDDVPAVPAGPGRVVGRLRDSERRRTGQQADVGARASDRDPPSRHRRACAKQFDATVLPMYIEQLESTPADAASLEPIVAPALDEGPHLSYTIQWFIFSVCVLVGWVLGGPPLGGDPVGQADQEATSRLHPDRRRRVSRLTLHPVASSTAIRRNCSTTFGEVYVGSRWR